jgi:hypothetical protein
MVELLLRNAGVDAKNIDDEGNTADVGVDAKTCAYDFCVALGSRQSKRS